MFGFRQFHSSAKANQTGQVGKKGEEYQVLIILFTAHQGTIKCVENVHRFVLDSMMSAPHRRGFLINHGMLP